jgi:hypothetical protein
MTTFVATETTTTPKGPVAGGWWAVAMRTGQIVPEAYHVT